MGAARGLFAICVLVFVKIWVRGECGKGTSDILFQGALEVPTTVCGGGKQVSFYIPFFNLFFYIPFYILHIP